MTATLYFDITWWKFTTCWLSVYAQFQDGVGSVLLILLLIMPANILIMHSNNQHTIESPDLYDQKQLRQCERSFSEWERVRITFYFTSPGSQYLICKCPRPITTQITQHARSKISNTELSVILPPLYLQYAIISFGILHHWWCFGNLWIIFMYFLLHHYIFR
jgi:hypothetical protein